MHKIKVIKLRTKADFTRSNIHISDDKNVTLSLTMDRLGFGNELGRDKVVLPGVSNLSPVAFARGNAKTSIMNEFMQTLVELFPEDLLNVIAVVSRKF